MVTRQTLVVVGVVLAATFGVVAPTVSAAPGHADRVTLSASALQETTDGGGTDDGGATADNESAFGTQVAAFMQSNAAQTEDSVENGMWEAAFERANASERAHLAERRAEKLDDRFVELREESRTLQERYRNDSLSYGEYVSAASRLDGRIEALEDGVNGTVRAAERAGVDQRALEELRTSARNMTGPEVAGVARGLTSGDRGPAANVPGNGPPGANATDRPGGPPADVAGNGPTVAVGNGTVAGNVTAGSPGDRGTHSDPGNATGNPDAPGQNEDGPPGRDGGPGEGGADAGGNDDSGSDRPGNSDGPGATGDDGPGNDAPGEDGAGNGGSGAGDQDASDSNGTDGESDADQEDGAEDDGSDRGAAGSNGVGNSASGGDGADAGPGNGGNAVQPGGILFTG